MSTKPRDKKIHYSELIRRIRLEKGFSTTGFGRKVGLSQSYISQLENNKTSHMNNIRIPLDTAKQICEGIGYSFKAFLTETGYLDEDDEPEILSLYYSLSDCDQKRLVSIAKSFVADNNKS